MDLKSPFSEAEFCYLRIPRNHYTRTSSTATFLTAVARVCCQEPPSYLTETGMVNHAQQYAIHIAVTGRVGETTRISYIKAVQLPWFSELKSGSL